MGNLILPIFTIKPFWDLISVPDGLPILQLKPDKQISSPFDARYLKFLCPVVPHKNRQKPRRTHVSLIIETLHMHEPTPVYQSPYSYFLKLRVSAICPSTGQKQGKNVKLSRWQ